MAIEIKELVIRATIEPGGAGAKPKADAVPGAAKMAGAGTKEIVSECVEQVLEILRQREER